jgi:hypothetical protein
MNQRRTAFALGLTALLFLTQSLPARAGTTMPNQATVSGTRTANTPWFGSFTNTYDGDHTTNLSIQLTGPKVLSAIYYFWKIDDGSGALKCGSMTDAPSGLNETTNAYAHEGCAVSYEATVKVTVAAVYEDYMDPGGKLKPNAPVTTFSQLVRVNDSTDTAGNPGATVNYSDPAASSPTPSSTPGGSGGGGGFPIVPVAAGLALAGVVAGVAVAKKSSTKKTVKDDKQKPGPCADLLASLEQAKARLASASAAADQANAEVQRIKEALAELQKAGAQGYVNAGMLSQATTTLSLAERAEAQAKRDVRHAQRRYDDCARKNGG